MLNAAGKLFLKISGIIFIIFGSFVAFISIIGLIRGVETESTSMEISSFLIIGIVMI